jgi:chemotaxis protein MotB
MELLEKRLKKEIDDQEVKLEMAERGLVITFVAEVLFDSGKAKIRPEAHSALDKVAKVIRDKVSDREIGVEGHTDNEPIKHSGWKSNWELSTARATSVLHYLVDEGRLNPKKLSAIGYGEYRPVVSNDAAEGRQKNRRVEIVIMPKVEKDRELGNKGVIGAKPVKYEDKVK